MGFPFSYSSPFHVGDFLDNCHLFNLNSSDTDGVLSLVDSPNYGHDELA